ncbi:hypothetical protein RhiTH_002578 [Rhizoctonia solani]
MPKPTPPTKPVLSTAAKAARRERATEYKNAKASTIAPALQNKGFRYHSEDEDDERDTDDDQGGAVDNNVESDKDVAADAETAISKMAEIPKYQPYKSKCGKYVFIPNETGDYEQYSMIDRPQGKLKGLASLMEMDGPENKELIKGIQSTIRTITRHVTQNIPNCTYPMLCKEQRVSIMVQACNKYQILARYRNNWATKEFIIRALTNSRDHQARIQKAGGQAAWCDKLKEQREAKRGGANKGKGKEQIERLLQVVPRGQSDSKTKVTPAPRPLVLKPKAKRRIEDSEDERESPSALALCSTVLQSVEPKLDPPGNSEHSETGGANRPAGTSNLLVLRQKEAELEVSTNTRKRARMQYAASPGNFCNNDPTPPSDPSAKARAKARAKAMAKAAAEAAAAAAAAAAEAAAAEAEFESDSDSDLSLELNTRDSMEPAYPPASSIFTSSIPPRSAGCEEIRTHIGSPTATSPAPLSNKNPLSTLSDELAAKTALQAKANASSQRPPEKQLDTTTQGTRLSTAKGTKRGRQAKQEMIDAADALLE